MSSERQKWKRFSERAGEIGRRMPRLRITEREGQKVAVDPSGGVALVITPLWGTAVTHYLRAFDQQTVHKLVALIQDVALQPDQVPKRYRDQLAVIAERLTIPDATDDGPPSTGLTWSPI